MMRRGCDQSGRSRLVSLRGKHGAGRFAIVDEEDFESVVAAGPWYGFPKPWTTYARRSGGRKPQIMHVLIMGRAGVDHVNHNGLDNRRGNLRFASPSENGANARPQRTANGVPCSSPYKGVSRWVNRCGTVRYRARILVHGKQISLGCFDTEEEAAIAYDDAAFRVFGAFAHLNFATRVAS